MRHRSAYVHRSRLFLLKQVACLLAIYSLLMCRVYLIRVCHPLAGMCHNFWLTGGTIHTGAAANLDII